MLSLATQIQQAVHSIGSMDGLSVKLAEAQDSFTAQRSVADSATILYSVMEKSAEDYVPGANTRHEQMVTFIRKVAYTLGKPDVNPDTRVKLAAAVIADNALTSVMETTENPQYQDKYAEARAFGREFLVELLQGVV